jgi:hypothetical protein
MIGNRLIALHPNRDPEAKEKWNSSSSVVLLVDGLTLDKLHPRVLDFIKSSSVKKLSVHASTGVYKGKPFDNRRLARTLLVVKDQTVMRGTEDESIF